MSDTRTNEAITYFQEGERELSKLLAGEDHAKAAILVAAVLRQNLVLSGLPGGGKSTLAEHMPRIFGAESSDIAFVPGKHDLSGTQLVGGEIVVEKEISDGKSSRTEKTVNKIEPIVTSDKRFVWMEEPNRANPHAIQTVLPVMENRRLEIEGKIVELPNIQMVVASMNPSDAEQSTFHMSDAMASRFGVGALMGVKGTTEDRLQRSREVRRLNKDRDLSSIQVVADPEKLARIGEYVAETAVPNIIGDRIDELAIHTADILEEHNVVKETDNRFTLQIESNAKAMAGLQNENHTVHQEDLRPAVYFTVAARLGVLDGFDPNKLDDVVDEIMTRQTA